MSALARLVADRDVIVCAGAGGVGKTTTAAALGVGLAARGRRVAVVTIDPARRLAQTLGVPELGNEPRRVEGDWGGELWALMLDPKRTLDGLVGRVARGERARDEILRSPIYRELSRAVAGTQEYTAVVRLCDLHRDPRFDTIVLDTPPSAHARDFLDAPERITGFLESRGARALLTPAGIANRALGLGARALGRLTGTDLLADITGFVALGGALVAGLDERAREVRTLLAAPTTTFVVITTPRAAPAREALACAAGLRERALAVGALVVTHMHPEVGERPDPAALRAALGGPLATRAVHTYDQAHAHRERDEQALAELSRSLPGVALAAIPHLPADAVDHDALRAIAAALL